MQLQEHLLRAKVIANSSAICKTIINADFFDNDKYTTRSNESLFVQQAIFGLYLIAINTYYSLRLYVFFFILN